MSPRTPAPFDPPADDTLIQALALSPHARRAKRALLYAVSPLLANLLLVLLIAILPFDRAGSLLYVISAVLSGLIGAVGCAIGMTSAVKILRTPGEKEGLLAALAAIPLGFLFAAMGTGTMLQIYFGVRGRQLRGAAFAELIDSTDWLHSNTPHEAPAQAPAGIADAWRKNGLTEHASVAAFSHLSAELLALGAPRVLIARAHENALDEIKHAELCFSLAQTLDGRSISPGQLPAAASALRKHGPRTWRLAKLAVETLADGALNEGWSARLIAELAQQTTDPRIQPILTEIARDEGRHAAHAFEVIRWCKNQGGHSVATALTAALRALPQNLGPTRFHPEAAEGTWEPYGLPSRSREDNAFRATRANLISRTVRLLTEN